MLFCENCGQCPHISDDYFDGYQRVSGTEGVYLNPNTGDIEDYGDADTYGEGTEEISCPYCNSTSIDQEWDGNESEAQDIRTEYERTLLHRSQEREKELRIANVAKNDWDN